MTKFKWNNNVELGFLFTEYSIHYDIYRTEPHINGKSRQGNSYDQNRYEQRLIRILKGLIKNHRCNKHEECGINK